MGRRHLGKVGHLEHSSCTRTKLAVISVGRLRSVFSLPNKIKLASVVMGAIVQNFSTWRNVSLWKTREGMCHKSLGNPA